MPQAGWVSLPLQLSVPAPLPVPVAVPLLVGVVVGTPSGIVGIDPGPPAAPAAGRPSAAERAGGAKRA